MTLTRWFGSVENVGISIVTICYCSEVYSYFQTADAQLPIFSVDGSSERIMKR